VQWQLDKSGCQKLAPQPIIMLPMWSRVGRAPWSDWKNLGCIFSIVPDMVAGV